MLEYSININKTDGCIHIAKDYHNKDRSIKSLTEKPFLFEVGMKVVDIFSNVVTIKEIIKHPPTTKGGCPVWNLLVEESGNCYVYYEIAGIYVKTIKDSKLIREIIDEEIPKPKSTKVGIVNIMALQDRIFEYRKMFPKTALTLEDVKESLLADYELNGGNTGTFGISVSPEWADKCYAFDFMCNVNHPVYKFVGMQKC